MANATAAKHNIIRPFPTQLPSIIDPANGKDELSWKRRRLIDIGVLDMADPTLKPPYWNTTMVTAWCAVAGVLLVLIGMVVGLWWFTWQTADLQGYQRGKSEAERQIMLDRLAKAEADAAKAKELEILNTKKPTPHPE